MAKQNVGNMKIITFIEEETVIKKILKHLNQWITGNHDPPLLSKAAGGDAFSGMPAWILPTDSRIIKYYLRCLMKMSIHN